MNHATPGQPDVSVHEAEPVPLVTVRGLGFAYGRGPNVLDDINLSLLPGRVCCLLGGSGCGKTTLLRLLAGLERPTRGTITIGDQIVSSAGRRDPCVLPEDRAVGYVFQDYALFPHLSALGNVTFGMRHRPRAERRNAGLELLDRVGLADYARVMPHTLSGGQQQRVALARALARDPKLMLLDEPFTGLDTVLRDELREVTIKLLRDTEAATLMVTHDPAEALLVADIVSVMQAGRLLVTAPPETVCTLQPRPKGPPSVGLQLDRITPQRPLGSNSPDDPQPDAQSNQPD